jgi:enoyl-CoA hydratase
MGLSCSLGRIYLRGRPTRSALPFGGQLAALTTIRNLRRIPSQTLQLCTANPVRGPASPQKQLRSLNSAGTQLGKATAPSTGRGDILCSVDPAPNGGGGLVATVTVANGNRLNSLNGQLITKLTSKLRSLASEADLRCVIIKGEISLTKVASFSSGADIYEMIELKNYDEATAFISRLHDACQAVRELPVVTIAQIHGLCLGGALELAAACDFRYATRTSTFSMPETKYGIPSVIEARLLANIVGWQKTKELIYFAKFYDGKQMEEWGLVDESCGDVKDLEQKVSGVAGLVASYGPEAMKQQKKLVRVWEEKDLVTGVEAGIDSYASMFKDGGSEPAKYMKVFTDRKR